MVGISTLSRLATVYMYTDMPKTTQLSKPSTLAFYTIAALTSQLSSLSKSYDLAARYNYPCFSSLQLFNSTTTAALLNTINFVFIGVRCLTKYTRWQYCTDWT